MSELEILPVGAVIVSTKTGGMLMRSPNGWIHTPSGTVCVCMAVTDELFAEAERTIS
jgi:cytochrome bd-type quinol oxidase subunit 1